MAGKRDTSALFDVPAGKRGRVETALNRSIAAARKTKSLDEVDAAALGLARAQARGVDVAEAARDVWALARIGGELRETLIRLRLDPVARGARSDSLTDFLASLSAPTVTGGPAVGNAPGS